ncbi:unnamed protein product [Didymodactylos carnosus]|uniref:Transposase n=1 Tax=Didymodactylos carnosus TaxID=1234261 RepID=A0A815BCZ0_9BILA|nr:unnamed protein product [Didymodactylos carnosus]CAF1268411.1 unnamed protein product [Didymodactylos carnosus]CAF3962341.1 unnamed protein product [Didymodactylos carnosus]CAF4053813.1 unnamed protein product [Didymodactylos carnosus]
MTPNRREYSNDLRSVVVQHFLNGDSYTEISKKTFVKRPTVQSMIKKYKNTTCIGNIIGRGRKRKTTAAVDRIIQRKLNWTVENRHYTVRNRALEIGFYGRTARKKPYVNRGSRFKRIKYARRMLKQAFGYWNNVLWSDESQFNLFGSDGKVMVWTTPKEAFDPKCTVATVKHGGGNLKVWGYFSRAGVDKKL